MRVVRLSRTAQKAVRCNTFAAVSRATRAFSAFLYVFLIRFGAPHFNLELNSTHIGEQQASPGVDAQFPTNEETLWQSTNSNTFGLTARSRFLSFAAKPPSSPSIKRPPSLICPCGDLTA